MSMARVCITEPTPGLPLSEAEFWELAQIHPELSLERDGRGALVVMAPAGADSDNRNCELIVQIGTWNRVTRLGKLFGSSAGFTLPNGAIRSPDAAWVLLSRWNALSTDERARFPHLCPDFVAEVRSPSDSPSDLRAKMREYIEQGARLGWLIDPIEGIVEIHRPGREPECIVRPRTLSGEDVMPGLVVNLDEILGHTTGLECDP
jgi:Uma2 family endonuclease